jgi:hypothetical protein
MRHLYSTLRSALIALCLSTSTVSAEPWATADKVLLGTATTAMALDWAQTRYIARNPDKFIERNPLLGKDPNSGRVDKHFGIAMLGMWGLSFWLGPENRRMLLVSVTVFETVTVINNARIGVRLDW